MPSGISKLREQSLRPPAEGAEDWQFFRRLLMVLAIAAFAYVVWETAGVLLLIFAAILLAVLLVGLVDFLARHTFLSDRWALAFVLVALAFLLIGTVVLLGTQIQGEVSAVFGRLPQALDSFGRSFGISDASDRIAEGISSGGGGQFFSGIAGVGYTVIGGLVDLILVLIAGIYLAADPAPYRRGVTKLFAPGRHELVVETMRVAAAALRFWFLGQLASMILVGVLSGLAFWIIGLPSAAGLGLIAGLTNFVPLLGPIIGAMPALLIAFNQDGNALLWTAAAILFIQQVEGNLILPLVQRRAVTLPPAVVLFAIAIFGALFGVVGVILAVPLAVLSMVLVQKIWIRETLGEETAVTGESSA